MRHLAAAPRRLLVLAVLSLLLLGLTASLAAALPAAGASGTEPVPLAQEDGDDTAPRGTLVEILPLHGFVDPPVAAQIVDVLELAEAEGAELVVLQLTSPGGVSADPDELLAAIEASPVPVAVLVGPLGQRAEAAGTAGLLWLAADVRAMVPDATVGPLAPADIADLDGDFPADVRAQAFGQATGVDEGLLADLVERPLGAEALEDAGVADLVVSNLERLLLDLDGYELADGSTVTIGVEEGIAPRFHSLGLLRRLLHAATTAPFIYLLLVVGLGALLFEVFQPGFGVAGLAGLILVAISGFGLTVLPVTWWAVALVVLGLVLYAVDTAIAGFGPVTLGATATFVFGSLNFYGADSLELSPWLVGATALTVLVFFVFIMTSLLRAQAGPEGVQVDDLVGKAGIVRSVLNPEGHVYLDGALWRARWTGDTKRAKVGTPVRVHGVDGPVVLVTAYDPDEVKAAARARNRGDAEVDADA
ncbi:hypothetical protein FTX61_04730 [Nitriliruptoraceae bacterium ZYF776]|nr:hypothetical protein [Profundirhabdus halotolerans]